MVSIFGYGLIFWFAILVVAVINGSIRDFLYKKRLGVLRSNQLSSIILSSMILIITYYFLIIYGHKETSLIYILLGLMWTAMTLAFEFLFFHYIMHHSWDELLGNYDLQKGNLWLLVVFTTATAPFLISLII
jgi:hypothetical protein